MVGDFFMCILQYLLIMIVLCVIGGIGGFVGVRLRRKKDAKTAAIKAEAASDETAEK